MKFKELSQKDKDYVKKIYKDVSMSWDERMDHLKTKFDCSERTIRKWCSEKLNLAEKTEQEPEVLTQAKLKQHNQDKKIFLITSAQGDTPIHKKFVANLEAYAKHLDAEILVIPFRYLNPTSVFTKEQKVKDKWDSKLTEYLTLNRHDLNNSVSVLSDVKIQPTASQPLQGLEGMTGEHSCVVGHPRIELKSIPVMEGSRPKFLFTSGACTIENYTDSKSGKKGEFHHSIGAAIIEIKDDETFFFRQISANSAGEFIDLFHHVKNGVVSTETEVEACAMGDIHVAHCDPRVTDITLNDLFKKLKPKNLFIHDIIDSQSISHHNLSDPFKQHKQEMDGSNSLQKEIDDMIAWLRQIEDYNVYVVKSNHDEHIDKFLRITDWRKMATFKNSIPYMKYSLATLDGLAPNGVVPYIINSHFPKMKCLGHNDYVSIKGYLMSVHGHIGASGSRGSLQQYSRLSTKTVTGHSHSIGRIGGAVSVGTSTHLRLDYNIGASSWSNSHGIVNRLGKFQHIVFMHTKDGLEYTTLNK
jgi:hypothetical protein